MTPDMRRLCLATIAAFDEWFDGDAGITPAGAEAIVRAVLMELREGSREMERAGGQALVEEDPNEPWVEIGHYRATTAFTAMLDYILDTKARRAAALQELANIDRDLL